MLKFIGRENQPLSGDELARHIARALAVEPPADPESNLYYRLVRFLFRPVVKGVDSIPDRPCLFVGNHSLFGLDGFILCAVMLAELGVFVRPLGDKFLFSSRPLAKLLLDYGAVMGHPEVCAALMQAKQNILVFPGGAHEAVKPTREFYKLQWKERYGFVRLAAEHGYNIVPMGIVGPDEFYHHLFEGEELPDTALGSLLRRFGVLTENTRRDLLPPIPLGALGSFFPKLQRCFVGFGEPVDLAELAGKKPTQAQLKKTRKLVAGRIEQQIEQMLALREKMRRDDGFWRRVLTV